MYLKSLEISPNDDLTYIYLGNLYSNKFSDYKKAEDAYLKSIEINPK